jgi:hypothetical protein
MARRDHLVRGGEGKEKWLAKVQDQDGSWSVQSDPAASWEQLARAVPQAFVRTTSLSAVRDHGGWLVWSHQGPGDYHCDLFGLTPARFDAILGAATRNPTHAQP